MDIHVPNCRPAILRGPHPGGDIGVVVQPGDDDFVSGLPSRCNGSRQRERHRGHVRAEGDAAVVGSAQQVGTGLSSGIDAAYQLASRTLVKGHMNRIVVLSDGDANIGNTGHDSRVSFLPVHSTDEPGVVRIVYDVEEQSQAPARVGRVIVIGNTRTKQNVVLRLKPQANGTASDTTMASRAMAQR